MKKYRLIFLILLIAGGWFFVNYSPFFERTPPQIIAPQTIYWDGKSPIALNFKDNRALKSISVAWRKKGEEKFVRLLKQNLAEQAEFSLLIEGLKVPRPTFAQERPNDYELEVTARDSSFFNWFMGNKTRRIIALEIDQQPPRVNVLAHSYSITRGGAAVVVFYAADEHLSEVYVQSGSHRFSATPFIKPGYFISLLAWDVLDDAYSADVYATDAAGNRARAHVRLFQTNKASQTSTITAKEAFVQGKIKDLYARYGSEDDTPAADAPNAAAASARMLDFINAKLRAKNEKIIHQITSRVSDELITDWSLQPFLPLKNAIKVANFADHRYYKYRGKIASESWHMGVDLASVKMAPIVLSNPGRLVFAEENGIYGLNLLVDHGLGLFSLYGHCSSSEAAVGEQLGAGTVIARTGTSGLALGDHLHFGVLIQGVEVRPEEWFDRHWLNTNIFNIINKAKASIK